MTFSGNSNHFKSKLNRSSVQFPEFKEMTAMLSVELSPICFSGFEFNSNSRVCECYHNQNFVRCNGDNAEIKVGYWIGTEERCDEYPEISLCPFCDFNNRRESTIYGGYYNLPRKLDDQCRPHRTGVACGDCSSGYTLAPDCVEERKCSWMLPLVIVLTILYWIVIVVGGCGLMHSKFQISLGHLYGILYCYSVVDVLLGSTSYISNGVFQLIAVISSFAKLTPQIIGKLCFVKGLLYGDQQFINYIHVIAVSLILFGISRAAKYSRRIANFGKHFLVRAVCVLLLLSYTSLFSNTFQLWRTLATNEYDSSADPGDTRYLAYAIVAFLCVI